MIRSLLSGLSGIQSNQVSLDVIGNNVANINTPSFKSGRASFGDTLSMTLRSGTSPSSLQGGLNPLQVGRGSTVGTVNNVFTQGSLETTNNPTDLAIAGEGFFVLRHGENQFFTRDGSFDVDADGTLVDPSTGFAVQGRMATGAGEILSSTAITDVRVPIESLFPARATGEVGFSGNLDAGAVIADAANGVEAEAYQTSVLVYDSLGDTHSVTVSFERTDLNAWSWTAEVSDGNAVTIWQGDPLAEAATGALVFSADGAIDTGSEAELRISGAAGAGNPMENGAAEMVIEVDMLNLVQYAGSFTPVPSSRDGHSAGTLDSINFNETGTLIGTFTNGATQELAQLVLADFHNPSGLTKIGENLYSISMNSGSPLIGVAGSSIQASVVPGALEGSNVDLANEFTKMIIAQRGFEANSRLVMTSDSILGELINLKR